MSKRELLERSSILSHFELKCYSCETIREEPTDEQIAEYALDLYDRVVEQQKKLDHLSEAIHDKSLDQSDLINQLRGEIQGLEEEVMHWREVASSRNLGEEYE